MVGVRGLVRNGDDCFGLSTVIFSIAVVGVMPVFCYYCGVEYVGLLSERRSRRTHAHMYRYVNTKMRPRNGKDQYLLSSIPAVRKRKKAHHRRELLRPGHEVFFLS